MSCYIFSEVRYPRNKLDFEGNFRGKRLASFFSCFFIFGSHSTSNKMNQRREEKEEGDLENSGGSISPLRSIAFQRVKVCVSNPDY